MKPDLVIASPGDLAGIFANLFEAEVRRTLPARGHFSCAVPGGSVAEAFFPALAALSLDWGRVDVFFSDERAVPPDDPASNYALARRLWLERARVPSTRVHPMLTQGSDLSAAASSAERELTRVLGQAPRLDLILLGVGPDGHVASLFPGHPALGETERWVAPVNDAPKPPPRRLTLTLPVLATARLVAVGAFGPEKAKVVRQAVTGDGPPLPLARVAHEAFRAVFFLDREAASLLPG